MTDKPISAPPDLSKVSRQAGPHVHRFSGFRQALAGIGDQQSPTGPKRRTRIDRIEIVPNDSDLSNDGDGAPGGRVSAQPKYEFFIGPLGGGNGAADGSAAAPWPDLYAALRRL